jgi:hypothetical protein
MAERNKLSQIADQQMPERRTNFLSQAWDEATGAFARYGRRSGAQRDASLAMLADAIDPKTGLFEGTALGGLGLLGLATHPLAVLPTGDEMRERAANAGNTDRLTQSIGGALTDFTSMLDPGLAAKGAAGSLAMFIGAKARNFPHAKVPVAEKLEAAGRAAEDIHGLTGLHRGADGKWRAEIDDSKATVSPELQRLLAAGTNPRALGPFGMKHPELLENYPQLAITKFTNEVPDGANGAAYGGRIGLSSDLAGNDLKSVALHEFQHEVANIEGFDPGSNLKMATGDIAQAIYEAPLVHQKMRVEQDRFSQQADNLVSQAKTDPEAAKVVEEAKQKYGHMMAGSPDDFAQFDLSDAVYMYLTDNDPVYMNMMKKWESYNKTAKMTPRERYRNQYGEIESRNTQARMEMDAAQRAKSFPGSTEDVPRNQQIVGR